MAMLDYDKIVEGIRKALYGYEVREYMAQSIEWTKMFVTQSVTRIEISEKNAKTSETKAATSATNAKTSEVNAKASADSMGTSVATCTTKAKEAKASEEAAAKSETAAKASKEAAEKSAELAGTRAGTDKTLSIENAPADAAVVGRYILDQTKDPPELVFYSKAEVEAKIKEILAAQREEDYKRVRYWVSDDPTSPASFIGGTWERVEGKFIMGANDTYPAGSTGGKASVTLEARNIPKLWGPFLAFDVSGNNFHVDQWGWKASVKQIDSPNGFNAYDGLYVNVGYDNNSAVDIMPTYVAKYVWQRIE
nr:MAG TPA: baseplate protein [Caudoviricetes sp.]